MDNAAPSISEVENAERENIVILAPSVSCLQQLLWICEEELSWLDMSINVYELVHGLRTFVLA